MSRSLHQHVAPVRRSIMEGDQLLNDIENRAVMPEEFVELRFKPGTWATQGLPERGCWIRTATLDRIIGEGGQLEVADVVGDLLKWLMVTPDRDAALITLSIIAERHGRQWTAETKYN